MAEKPKRKPRVRFYPEGHPVLERKLRELRTRNGAWNKPTRAAGGRSRDRRFS